MKEKKLLNIQTFPKVLLSCASYKSNYVTYVTATYSLAKRRCK